MTENSKGSRITHRDTGAPAEIDDLIDEAVVTHLPDGAHVEMMSDEAAWMRLGEEVFWIWAKKGKLFIRYSEHRPATVPSIPAADD